jgi:endonuclease/exonuclease/phosphatase (EEP) superfamily protein YafD
MKIVKLIVSSFTFLLAFLSIIICIGSIACKYIDLPENSFVQIFGYVAFFWIILASAVVLILFLILGRYRNALSYFGLLVLFTLLLDDFSLQFVNHKIPRKGESYDSLNIAAYNVKHYDYGIERISAFIKKSGLDILLLSESDLTPEKIKYIKETLPEYTVLTDNGHDLSILSKYPVVSYRIVELPTYLASFTSGNDIEKLKAGGIHRSFVHAVVNVNGTLVNVLSLRLIAGRPKDKSLNQALKWGKYLLQAQEEEVSSFISYSDTLRGPVICGGDLNVPPNTEIIHKIKHYMTDTFLEDHMFGPLTFKVSFPTMRIDYLFHSRDLISKGSEVIRLNPPLSDHFPVNVKFFIPKTERLN